MKVRNVENGGKIGTVVHTSPAQYHVRLEDGTYDIWYKGECDIIDHTPYLATQDIKPNVARHM
jgi:hypothetical protein